MMNFIKIIPYRQDKPIILNGECNHEFFHPEFFGSFGFFREGIQILGLERAYARSNPKIWGSTTAGPKEPIFLV
jgi:hypothetical protein